MTEKDLIELGFNRQDETAENSGSVEDWYYYTLAIGNNIYNEFCLITDSSDTIIDDNWCVYFFDLDTFKFTNRYQLEKLIEVLKYNINDSKV